MDEGKQIKYDRPWYWERSPYRRKWRRRAQIPRASQNVEKDNTLTMPVEKTKGSAAGFIANDRRAVFKFGQSDSPRENGRKVIQRALWLRDPPFGVGRCL